MKWHKDYTKKEIENLLTNMCNWIGELTGEDTIGIVCALDNIYNGEEE